MRTGSLKLAAVAALVAIAGTATAKVNVAGVMHERHEGMESLGKAFKALRREFDSRSPDVATIRATANQVGDLARRSSGWYAPGTGPEAGKTGAKAEIWKNWPDFVAKERAFQQSAEAFRIAAASGDMAAAKARYSDLGGTCKACHDKYRTEMHH